MTLTRKCPFNISTKLQLRIGLLAYLCLLLVVPEYRTLYRLCVNIAASVISASATLAFIMFLVSRKPVEKNILNRQILMHFYFKLFYYPYYFMIVYVGYSSRSQQQANWEKVLMSTVLSYSSARIMVILNITMYTLISASRTLLFLSPVTFNALNKMLVLLGSMLIMLLVFAFELFMAQVKFSPAKCDVNENGIHLHKLPHSINNKTSSEIPEKSCQLFPSFRIVLCMFLFLEGLRFTVAVWRKFKMLKKLRKVSVRPTQAITLKRQMPVQPVQAVEINRSDSLPTLNFAEINNRRRLSLPEIKTSLHGLQRKTNISTEIPEQNEARKEEMSQTSFNNKQLKNYMSFLIFRTYTLVIIIAFFYLISFFMPSQFDFLWQLKFQIDLAYLELYFVPVFWILIDKDAWNYTKKNVKKMSIGFKFARK